MEDNLQLSDVLLRRFENRYYDLKANKILHGAFSPSSEDKRVKSPISANCLRILEEIMNKEPLEFTLDGKSPDNFAVLAISVDSVKSCSTDSENLTVQLDPFDGNESHCGIHGYPYDSDSKIKRNVRRALANKSSLYEKP